MKGLFQAGRPVIGNRLIGREDVLKEILYYLTSGESVVLIAPRRFGKTSMVLELLNRLKKTDMFTAYVDIFAAPEKKILAEQITAAVLSNKKLHKSFYKFKKNISAMLHQVEFKQAVEDFEFILKFADKNQDELDLLANSIDFIDQFSEKYNQSIVFAFDEFGDIEKLNGGEIVKLFRSKIQLQKHSSYIFSGSQESLMEKIFITSKSPFYRFAKVIQLNEIDAGIFKKFIKKEFKKIDVFINDDALHILLNFTKGHPYYTQLICRQMEFEFSDVSDKTIGNKEIYMAIENAYWSEINYIEKLWQELSAVREQLEIVIAIAQGITSLYNTLDLNKLNVSRAVRNLRTKGIIKKENKVNILRDPMLKFFIRKEVLKWDLKQCIV